MGVGPAGASPVDFLPLFLDISLPTCLHSSVFSFTLALFSSYPAVLSLLLACHKRLEGTWTSSFTLVPSAAAYPSATPEERGPAGP